MHMTHTRRHRKNIVQRARSVRTLASDQAREKGFTLLLAALIASIVLSLGVSIAGLIQKELILSSTGRDSQFAFYAADSGAECALYWDVRKRVFSSASPPSDIACTFQTIPVSVQ